MIRRLRLMPWLSCACIGVLHPEPLALHGQEIVAPATTSVDLGRVDDQDGLANRVRGNGGDGENESLTCGPADDLRQGRSNFGSEDPTRDVDDLYLYFTVIDSRMRRHTDFVLDVTVYDAPDLAGLGVDLQYTNDRATGPSDLENVFFHHPVQNILEGTGQWVVLKWKIEDAGFRSFQQGQADFRLAVSDGKRICVDRVDLVFFPLPSSPSCALTQHGVELGWNNEGLYDAIEISRNGELIASLAGSATTYLDAMAPTGVHQYEILGVAGERKGGSTCSITVFFHLPRQSVDPSTLRSKTLCGYQGWFRARGDGSGAGWVHWSRRGDSIGPGLYTVEMWPDLSEFTEGELFSAPGVTLLDGSQGKLFSSVTPLTVLRHFEWMKEYGIDGVFLQRFVGGLNDPFIYRTVNQVLRNVRNAAKVHGRVFALEYDTSGVDPAELFELISSDWKRLVGEEDLRNDPRYLHHDGRPVVEIWGLGFEGRGHTPDLAARIIDFFKNDPDYGGNLVIGGVPTHWRTLRGDSEQDPGWRAVYRMWDIINPWMVGRFIDRSGVADFKRNVWAGDLAETRAAGIGYLPVVWPGFGWDNLMRLAPGTSLFPRRGGEFFWDQIFAFQELGVDMMFVAMFDEVDEATAVFKISDNHPVTDHWITLEGFPSDWFLRLTGAATRMLRGDIALTPEIPIQPVDDPDIELVSLDLGMVSLGSTTTGNVVVTNSGSTNPLTILNATVFDRDASSFKVLSTPGPIDPSEEGNIVIEFDARSEGFRIATLEVTSNDPFDNVKHATLRALVRGVFFLRGDCNGDNVVDISDAVRISLVLFGNANSGCLTSCDTNNDHQSDVSDIVVLLQLLFRNGPALEPPFPVCGRDPDAAANSLGCDQFSCE